MLEACTPSRTSLSHPYSWVTQRHYFSVTFGSNLSRLWSKVDFVCLFKQPRLQQTSFPFLLAIFRHHSVTGSAPLNLSFLHQPLGWRRSNHHPDFIYNTSLHCSCEWDFSCSGLSIIILTSTLRGNHHHNWLSNEEQGYRPYRKYWSIRPPRVCTV